MKSIYTNGERTRYAMISDNLWHLMEIEKARMMSWLDKFSVDSPIHKTDTIATDDANVYETLSTYTLSEEITEYPYKNIDEIDRCVYDEDGNDITDGNGNLVYELSSLEMIPYVFLFMIYNFPDLCYKILEVRHILGDMGLDYDYEADSFSFSTIITKNDLMGCPINDYEKALFNKVA